MRRGDEGVMYKIGIEGEGGKNWDYSGRNKLL
jgi:hypothetical protein